MSVEGVFRKNGNIRRLKEVSDAFDKQTIPPPLDEEHPVQLAALLKKFLRELPDPLLTFKLQRLWLACQRPPAVSRI
jgi:RhoGAP domain